MPRNCAENERNCKFPRFSPISVENRTTKPTRVSKRISYPFEWGMALMCTERVLWTRVNQKRVPVGQNLSFSHKSYSSLLNGFAKWPDGQAFRVVIGEFLLSFNVFEHIRQCNYTFRYAGIVLVCTFNVSGMVISVLEVYHVLWEPFAGKPV